MSTSHDPYAGAPRTKPVPEEEKVPEGTAREILSWVSEDVERAAEALESEKVQDKPRKTLMETLKGIISDGN